MLRFSFFAFIFFAVSLDSHAIEGVDCTIAKFAIKTASSIRGLSVKKQVACKLQDKKQVERYLRDAISKKIPEEKIRLEGRVYKLLGFIPKEFDYFDGIIQMYLSQLGGYYDPENEYYAMASWMPAPMQLPIAIHELTHALQDQHYDLDALIQHEGNSSDYLMARSALVEGDATAVMLDYSRSLAGIGPISKEESISGFMLQNLSGAMLSPGFRETPPSMQAMLIFPYVSGLNFVHALLVEGSYSKVHQVFTRPPQSTEEILHPKKYLAGGRDFITIATPGVPEGISIQSTIPVFEDTLGEFAIATLLRNWLSPQEASRAAAGWGGDRIALYEVKNGSRGIVRWQLHWDTQTDADEFFELFTQAIEKRFEQEAVRTSARTSLVTEEVGTLTLEKQDLDIWLTIGR